MITRGESKTARKDEGGGVVSLRGLRPETHRLLKMTSVSTGKTIGEIADEAVRFHLGARRLHAFARIGSHRPAIGPREEAEYVVEVLEEESGNLRGVIRRFQFGEAKPYSAHAFRTEGLGQAYYNGRGFELTFDRGKTYWLVSEVSESEAGVVLELVPVESVGDRRRKLLQRAEAVMSGLERPSGESIVEGIRRDRARA